LSEIRLAEIMTNEVENRNYTALVNKLQKKIIMKKLTSALLTLVIASFTANAQTIAPTRNLTSAATTKTDQAAYNLLKEAHENRESFPLSFAGYSSDFTFNDNGKIYNGTFSYVPKVSLKLNVNGLSEADDKFVNEAVSSLVAHRRNPDFTKADGKYPINFGADDNSPLGRLICLDDDTKSCYRVKNAKVTQVNRTMEGMFFTINVLEITPTENGHFLPRQFTVTYFDEKTKAMKKSQSFSDEYENVNGAWLPKSRRIITSENGNSTVKSLEFKNFKLNTPNH
jgi:hypothetical protein